jgi:hypothetical protein
MAARRIRSAVARFVVVTSLAVAVFAGSHAFVEPTHVSAARNCEDLTQWYNLYKAHAFLYWNLYVQTGNLYYAYQSGYYEGLANQVWATPCD